MLTGSLIRRDARDGDERSRKKPESQGWLNRGNSPRRIGFEISERNFRGTLNADPRSDLSR